MDFIDILKTLALIWASFQLLLIHLWRKLFRQGEIKIYKEGKHIVLGYSSDGISISLQGTLRAVNQDFFIKKIGLTLRKQSPGKESNWELQKKFEWRWLRRAKLKAYGPADVDFEEAKARMITSKDPVPFDIFFHDPASATKVQSLLEALYSKWTEKLRHELGIFETQDFVKGIAALTQEEKADLAEYLSDAQKRSYAEFQKETDFLTCLQELRDECYWREGKYEIEMLVETDDPPGTFKQRWPFSLKKEKVRTLDLNPLIMIQQTCGQQKIGNLVYLYVEHQ